MSCGSFGANSSSFVKNKLNFLFYYYLLDIIYLKGLNIVLTNYFEEIRIGKNKFDLLLDILKSQTNYKFNNTLYNSSFASSLKYMDGKNNETAVTSSNTTVTDNNTNIITFNTYNTLDPFSIFNDNSIRNIGLVNRFLIRPSYEALRSQLETSINSRINSFELTCVVIISTLISFIVIYFFFIWRPFEDALNTSVIKTLFLLIYFFELILILNLLDFQNKKYVVNYT